MIFYADSTIRFSVERGFSESYYILCPVCWNWGIHVTLWEDGSEDLSECLTCRRMDEAMERRDCKPR